MKHIFFIAVILFFTQALLAGAEINLSNINAFQFPEVSFYCTIALDGEPVRNLTTADFIVQEDSSLITEFTLTVKSEPIQVALVLDTSGSVKPFIEEIRKGADTFINGINDQDKAMIVEFSNMVTISQKPTFEKQKLLGAIRNIRPGGGTKLYDGVYRAIQEIEGKRKFLVVFTDGKDVQYDGDSRQYSDHTLDEVIQLAKQQKVKIYTIGIGKGISEEALKRMAVETDGKFLHSLNTSDISNLYERVQKILIYQYHFTYQSPKPEADGKWREVTVKQKKTANMGKGRYLPEKKVLPVVTEKTSPPEPKKFVDVKGYYFFRDGAKAQYVNSKASLRLMKSLQKKEEEGKKLTRSEENLIEKTLKEMDQINSAIERFERTVEYEMKIMESYPDLNEKGQQWIENYKNLIKRYNIPVHENHIPSQEDLEWIRNKQFYGGTKEELKSQVKSGQIHITNQHRVGHSRALGEFFFERTGEEKFCTSYVPLSPGE